MLPFLDLLSPIINKVLDYIPDPQKKAEMQLQIQQDLEAHQEKILSALLASDQAQAAINEKAAASTDLFSERARPAALWMCVVALGWQGLIVPVVQCVIVWTGHVAPVLPSFSADLTHDLLYGLLGLGGLHAYQAIKSN